MAGTSLLALIDDIASILDDVAVMSKVAAKKTAGVLGDDLALNAHQVAGVHADRELPVVWAVAKGSLKNKAILVPAALAISALIPWAITPLLMVGGAFLCYEGFEKIADKFLHDSVGRSPSRRNIYRRSINPAVDLVAVEKAKINGAIRTDLSCPLRSSSSRWAQWQMQHSVNKSQCCGDRHHHDRRGLWLRRRHRQTRRRRAAFEPVERQQSLAQTPARRRRSFIESSAVLDEEFIDCRHHRHVHGRRRHSYPRYSWRA